MSKCKLFNRCTATGAVAQWCSGLVTQRLRVRVPPGLLSSNNREQVIYTHGPQANSAFHPFGLLE